MVPVVLPIFLLQRDVRLVIVVEDGMPPLQDRYPLAMDRAGIEEKGGTGGPCHLDDSRGRQLLDLGIPVDSGMLPAMGPDDVLKRPCFYVREVHGKLHLARDVAHRRLVVPRIRVPSMEISRRRHRPPSLRFDELVSPTEVAA